MGEQLLSRAKMGEEPVSGKKPQLVHGEGNPPRDSRHLAAVRGIDVGPDAVGIIHAALP
jgi:hypothetical protein